MNSRIYLVVMWTSTENSSSYIWSPLYISWYCLYRRWGSTKRVREKHSLGCFIFSTCQSVYSLGLLSETIILTRTNEDMLGKCSAVLWLKQTLIIKKKFFLNWCSTLSKSGATWRVLNIYSAKDTVRSV